MFEKLKQYFAGTTLPDTFEFNRFEVSIDTRKTVSAHLAFVEQYQGKRIAAPYLARLRQIVEATGGNWAEIVD